MYLRVHDELEPKELAQSNIINRLKSPILARSDASPSNYPSATQPESRVANEALTHQPLITP
jgi:hypothetical protein